MIVTLKKYPELGRLRVVEDKRKNKSACLVCALDKTTACRNAQAPKNCLNGYRFEAIKK